MNTKTFSLSNKQLSVQVNTKGAELSSILSNGKEYLWQADPTFWGRHAPILFPIVGRLLDDEYVYKGQKYALGQHGFARDQTFSLVKQKKNSLTFELVHNEDLLKIYPFKFALQVTYRLLGSGIKVEYMVLNASEQDKMLFSIGAHPAFNCPMEKGHQRDEYKIKFDLKEAPKAYLAENAYYDGSSVEVLSDGILPLSDSVFDRGSLTFRPNHFAKATLIHTPSQKEYLSVKFKNYPFLAIWSKDNQSPFVCVEPWHGVADHINHDKELTNKKGIITLAPRQVFRCAYLININN